MPTYNLTGYQSPPITLNGVAGAQQITATGTVTQRGATGPTGATGANGGTDIVLDTSPQLGGNLDLNGFTVGAATAANLTKLNALTADATELNYVDGVTSAIQTQLNAKAASSHTHTKTDLTDVADFLLESEVDADIKTLSLPASTTISAFGATLTDDADAGTARTTLGLGTIAVLAAPSGTVVGTSDTQTLTNKRTTARVTTITSHATPTINTDNCDAVSITALATNITSMTTNLSGTPNNFDKLIIRFLDDGTARTIAWGAGFASRGATLPTTTVISKLLTVGFIYNSVTSLWGCVATAQET